MDGGKVTAGEGPEDAENPGYEVQIKGPDGAVEVQYVFEKFAGHDMPNYRFEIQYQPPQMPKDYISELTVLEDGQERVRRHIEVNHPLSYGGYLFHQQSWGQDEHGLYSVIGVVSNSGLEAVFTGYAVLAAGIAGQLWIVPAYRKLRRGKRSA